MREVTASRRSGGSSPLRRHWRQSSLTLINEGGCIATSWVYRRAVLRPAQAVLLLRKTMEPTAKVNILLVDDNPGKLLTLETILTGLGQNLVKARSAQEALWQLMRQEFAVLLLDVQMPDMDGFELAALIRGHQRYAHIPIIFISTVNRSEMHIFKGYALGAVDYLDTLIPEVLRAKVAVFVDLFKKTAEVRQLNAELERRVEERTAELRRSNEELQQFAYVASHDLQEPLRMVTSYVQLLAQRYQGQLDSEAQEFIGYAVEGAQRMKALIDDLLAYSRVNIRERLVVPTDSGAVLQQTLQNLHIQIAESGATVTADPLPTVSTDRMQLGLLWQNLLSNALKFRGQEPPRVHVSARRQGNEWVFSVRDNGIGMEPRHTERIFQMFQRLHTRQEYPGTGIGLAICKKIVERHGGRIWVESEPGQGTTFSFTLPAA
jgi:two-component system, sensor histidine kinase and response regulator